MSSDPKDQKTAILQEAPPEVQKLVPWSSPSIVKGAPSQARTSTVVVPGVQAYRR